MVDQARGFAGRTVFDWEDTYNTSRAFASRRPLRLGVNRNTVGEQQPLEYPNTLTGKRFQVDPFLRFKASSGDIEAPLDADQWLNFMKAAMGTPTITEVPASDVKSGSPTLTISSGVGTFSVAQTAAAVGQRVIYSLAGVRYTAFLETKNTTSEWVLSLEKDGATNAPDITAATVVAIIPNLVSATPGAVTIADGVGTFTQAQSASVVVGCQVICDIENALKRYFISVKTSSTVMTLVDSEGFPAPDGTSLQVDSIEAQPTFDHVYLIDEVGEMPSFEIEKLRKDLYPNISVRNKGVKCNAVAITVGNDAELLGTLGLMGASEDRMEIPYDVDDVKVDATITLSSGAATFSASQTGASVGDVCIYRASTWEAGGAWHYVTLESGSGTSWTVLDEDGAVPDDITAAVVMHVYTPADNAVAGLRTKFENFDWQVYEDAVLQNDIAVLTVNIDNQMDGGQYTINTQGVRRDIPSSIIKVSGTLEALMLDDRIIEKAQAETISSLKVVGTNGSLVFELEFDQVRFEKANDVLDGPGGTRITTNWTAIVNDDNTYNSPVRCRIRSYRAIGSTL